MPHNIADIGSMVWYVYLGSLLLLVPFLARSQNFMREFSLLAAISTVATSLDLLFVAVFSLGQFASLTLSLFVSLALYAGVRQWILNQLLGNSMLTTERMFEQLYRIAREVEAQPERTPALLSQLLSDLFEPLEVEPVERRTSRTRIAGDGSGMLIPVPQLGGDPDPARCGHDPLRPARAAPFHHRGRAPDRPHRRAAAPGRAFRQGRRAGPQRRTPAARARPARRHRRAPADPDVQGPVAPRWKTTCATRCRT